MTVWPIPLPIIWLIGESQTGKTSFITHVDPVRPGEETRTLITDIEGSSVSMEAAYPIERIDIRSKVDIPQGPGYAAALFKTWWDTVMAVPDGKYTVLGVDPTSDLYIGAHQWVKVNPGYFDKPDGAFRGKEGTMYAWGDAKVLWKQIGLKLAEKFQTVVLTSHTQDIYGDDGVRTGEFKARGTDFNELATLCLWLAREPRKDQVDKLWAKVHKSRLTHAVWPEDGEPMTAPVLPIRLEPKPGQTYPSLIREYMRAPQPDYGELNVIEGYDPSIQLLSEEEKEARRIAAQEQKLKLDLIERKREVVTNLVDHYEYASADEVRRTIHELGLDDLADDITTVDRLEQALIDHRQKEVA